MKNTWQKYTAEFLATFMLCFVGAGSMVTNHLYEGGGLLTIALAHGLALSVAVSATLNVSGAHINPAVTAIMLILGRIKPVKAAGYVMAQLSGAIVAGAAVKIIFGGVEGGVLAMEATGLGTPTPGSGVSIPTALITEIMLTFLLVFVIFGTAVDRRAPAIGGFGIGLAVAANILMGGPISGASMNPARTFGPALLGGVWDAHWIYWAGPLAGAILGGLAYQFLILEESN